MQPLEPCPPGTSLEISSEPDAGRAADAAGTGLELPHNDSVPSTPPTPPATVEHPPGVMLGDLVVSQFRQAETATLGRILVATLAETLPSSIIRLERPRSLGRRLARRTAEPIGISIAAGDRTLSLRVTAGGGIEAVVGQTVRGVSLSATPVLISQWLDALAELLNHVATDDTIARSALEQTLLS